MFQTSESLHTSLISSVIPEVLVLCSFTAQNQNFVGGMKNRDVIQ